jgi:hypothetical protein
MEDWTPIPEHRPLTRDEMSLVKWLLENRDVDAAEFLPQLDQLMIVSRCPCGCASIDFGVAG